MESSRICLRPFKLSDADDFLNWASDDKVTHYLRWNTITSAQEAFNYIQRVAIPHPWRHSMIAPSVTFPSAQNPETIAIEPTSEVITGGLGIVTIAIKMAIPRVFEKFPFLVRLEALVEEGNIGSQRVLEKLGFVREGFLRKYGFNKGEIRDMYVYSFLKTDKISS